MEFKKLEILMAIGNLTKSFPMVILLIAGEAMLSSEERAGCNTADPTGCGRKTANKGD